jgi:RNA polymerase sigma-70 factor (ECF subfamily)
LPLNGTDRALPLPLIRAKYALAPVQPESAPASDQLIHSTDEELLQGVQGHDENSALALFHRYSKIAFSVGLKILQDEGEAEDLVQEIFIRFYSEANTFESGKGSARTWIILMIYRRAFDRRSYLHRRHFYFGTDAVKQANTLVERRSTEKDIIDRLTVEQLKSAFSELSDRQRETLEVFFFEGLKLTEIAERTGEDIKNVRHHYYRGLERLRQITRQMLRPGNFNR